MLGAWDLIYGLGLVLESNVIFQKLCSLGLGAWCWGLGPGTGGWGLGAWCLGPDLGLGVGFLNVKNMFLSDSQGLRFVVCCLLLFAFECQTK